MTELFVLLLIGLIAYYLWDSNGLKERAIQKAKQACQHNNVQFLDGSVAIQKTRLAKGHGGNPQWQRQYQFEFTVGGAERYSGKIQFMGTTLELLELEPHPVPEEPLNIVERPACCPRG